MTQLADDRPPARHQLIADGRRGRLAAAADHADTKPERALWRSRRVAYLKLVLPGVALLIVTLILAWPHIGGEGKRVQLTGSRITVEDTESLRMINARYVGIDDQHRPYVITSVLASQASAHAPATDLQEPKADMTGTSGSWTAVTSHTGIYQKEAKLLDLAGEVSVYQDGGTEFHTDRASVDLGAGSAAGDDPVDGQGPTSVIKSVGFRIYDRGARVVFTGKARLVLYQAGAQP